MQFPTALAFNENLLDIFRENSPTHAASRPQYVRGVNKIKVFLFSCALCSSWSFPPFPPSHFPLSRFPHFPGSINNPKPQRVGPKIHKAEMRTEIETEIRTAVEGRPRNWVNCIWVVVCIQQPPSEFSFSRMGVGVAMPLCFPLSHSLSFSLSLSVQHETSLAESHLPLLTVNCPEK